VKKAGLILGVGLCVFFLIWGKFFYTPEFSSKDIPSPTSLLNKLKSDNPVAKGLRSHFSPEFQAKLEKFTGKKAETQLVDMLLKELNALLKKNLAKSSWASKVILSKKTKRFLAKSKENSAILNRLLLEDAYPEDISRTLLPQMLYVIGVGCLMACFWVSEVIPIPATSLIPLVMFPLLGILNTGEVAPSYADKMIMLLMGGFFIATVIEKVHLHKRIALNVINTIGTSPKQILLGFMVATAFLSMWISNTATTLMMLPIALAVVAQLEKNHGIKGIGTAFMLAIAYSASVGGVGTPIGTPPNLIMLSQYNSVIADNPGQWNEISFASWMMVGIPLVIIIVGLMWVYMTSIKYKFPTAKDEGSSQLIKNELDSLGTMSYPEKVTMVLFIITSLLWIFRQTIVLGPIHIVGWSNLIGLEKYVDDTTVAMFMALVMFSFPIGEGKKLLDWNTAKKIPWGLLLLFGGGIALAEAFKMTGLSSWLGANLESAISGFPIILMLAIICFFMTFLTEITSNTAVTTVMMPILAITAISLGVSPALLMMPAAISASFAFMLPVATAPNAIMYSTEKFTIAEMAKTGFFLNLMGVAIVTIMMYTLGRSIIF